MKFCSAIKSSVITLLLFSYSQLANANHDNYAQPPNYNQPTQAYGGYPAPNYGNQNYNNPQGNTAPNTNYPRNNGGWGNTPWNNGGWNNTPWNNNNQGNNPYNNAYNTPWNNNSGWGNMPWNNNNNGWGNGGRNPLGPRNPSQWMNPNKQNMSNNWDDMLNAPSRMGRMPGGWRAPSVGMPNPIDVGDEFSDAARDIPDQMNNFGN